jgi:hypothetical protein
MNLRVVNVLWLMLFVSPWAFASAKSAELFLVCNAYVVSADRGSTLSLLPIGKQTVFLNSQFSTEVVRFKWKDQNFEAAVTLDEDGNSTSIETLYFIKKPRTSKTKRSATIKIFPKTLDLNLVKDPLALAFFPNSSNKKCATTVGSAFEQSGASFIQFIQQTSIGADCLPPGSVGILCYSQRTNGL